MSSFDFHKLSNNEKLEIFQATSALTDLPDFAVEKDWWVVQTLSLIFQKYNADQLVFKGGTSLSKAWGLIQRFSEDIDLALNREFLGFKGELSKSQVRKLRRASNAFVSSTFYPNLVSQFKDVTDGDVKIILAEIKTADQDPLVIEIEYPSVTSQSNYVQPKVLVEIGGRSMHDPYTPRSLSSLVGEYYPNKLFADEPIEIPVVNPERTFLEKIFLLHEEHQRPDEKRRVHRLSRHLYDIERISNTHYAATSMSNHELFQAIVVHRERFSNMGGVDYTKHFPPHLNPVPPTDVIEQWESDYNTMKEQMIFGESPSFKDLISSVQRVVDEINNLDIECPFKMRAVPSINFHERGNL
jgi:Nucleotidyl transferase AbiEii toxin, Type IV TA system